MFERLESRQLFSNLPAGFVEKTIGSNLGEASAIDVLPDGRALIAVKSGSLRLVLHSAVQAKPVITIAVDDQGERGLIGVTHDPDFATNHFIYAYHTVAATASAAAFNEVTRYTMPGKTASVSSGVNILALNRLSSATNHNGGGMHFGNDGLLYVGVGENAKTSNAQTLGNLLGKILRIDVSQSASGDPINDVAKIVPADNPFVDQAVGINGAIFALGFRNPFSFSVQPTTGQILVDDVGSKTWEEVDRLLPGRNYGWPRAEGFAASGTPANLGPGVYANPILEYNHHGGVAGGGNAIIGGAFYSPPSGAANAFPAAYTGDYFYADYGHNYIRYFDPRHHGTPTTPDISSLFEATTAGHVTALTLASDGGLYYLSDANNGQLSEIVHA